MDSCVEVLLNPSGDRKNYFHIGVNLNGAISDLVCVRDGKPDYSWSSDCKPIVRKHDKGFYINLSINKRVFGKIDHDSQRIAPAGGNHHNQPPHFHMIGYNYNNNIYNMLCQYKNVVFFTFFFVFLCFVKSNPYIL